jgi:hypothetical protein
MTAEIAILNKNGIALAADSKVTIGGGSQQKTFDTVNKVFTLSKLHPVGAMIFGNAEFMRYPWETIVKLYRKQKNVDSEPTIKEWGADFVRYLRQFGKIRPEDKILNICSILGGYFSQLDEYAFEAAEQKVLLFPLRNTSRNF